jgi:hypothetical protein
MLTCGWVCDEVLVQANKAAAATQQQQQQDVGL